MAASKRAAKVEGLSVYTFTGTGFFISAAGMEADLPQPTDGNANCWIASLEADEIREYDDRNALEALITSHFKAMGLSYLPAVVYVDYYSETWEDYTALVGRAEHIKKNRGSGLSVFYEGF